MNGRLHGARNATQYLVSAVTIGVISLLCLGARDVLDYRVVGYMLLVAVSLLAMSFRIKPVLLAALLSALILNFCFIKPYYNFNIHSTEDTLLLLMYFIIALVNGVLTYKIRAAEQLARAREARWNTMKLYNTMLDSLSHELRTPISTIMGAIGTLQDKTNRISAQNEERLLAEMEKASLRLNHQVENLLNMSRLESGYIKPNSDWCDLAELVYKVIDSLREELGDHQITVKRTEYLPLFKLDYGLTEQIIYNLVFNASQHTVPESAIIVNLEYLPEVDSELQTARHTCRITIGDNGAGFPADTLSKVFDKFYRIQHAMVGGTGLGLSIVKGFVEAQNGIITVRNGDNGGAEFRILFPAAVMHTNSISNG